MEIQTKPIREGLLATEWGQGNEKILSEPDPNHSLALIPLPFRLRFAPQ
jgi:hypothetical protein